MEGTRRAAFVLGLLLGGVLSANASEPPTPGSRLPAGRPEQSQRTLVPPASATRVRGAITVDGRLDEETWTLATPVTSFLQRTPNEGQPPTERTEVRLAYDDNALYVGARMFDEQPAAIVRRVSKRDAESSSDLITIYLDPRHDHTTGVMLIVSAAGSQGDAWLSDDRNGDDSWDAVWDAAAVVDSLGWTAEIRIPFSQLRFSSGNGQTWGMNIKRFIQRRNEEDWWVFLPKNDTRLVSAFGHLDGLDIVNGGSHLEVLPYASSRLQRSGTSSASDPFNSGNRLFGGAGLDLKWGMTSSFTLDATLNPDFGQVEVDPAVVNLTAFETFYQEKRPFFIEGSDQFNTFGKNGLVLYARFGATYPTLFYSRRIGRAPHLSASGDYVSTPASTTIIGATKLTGRTAGGWSMTAVSALTGSESARVVNENQRSEFEVEPLTNYTAARASRQVGKRASIGMLGTVVRRDLRTGDERDAMASGAYVGGTDGYYYFDAARKWVLSGSVAGSIVNGDASMIGSLQRSSARYYQRPDAVHVRLDPSARSLSGWTGQINLNRTRGDHWLDVAAWEISPGFESNDMGYSPQADRVGGHVGWLWQKPKEDGFTRERYITVVARGLWNTAGDRVGGGMQFQTSTLFKNYFSINTTTSLDLPFLDDRITRGGPIMLRPSAQTFDMSMRTDSRKVAWLALGYEGHHNGGGGWYNYISPNLYLNLSPSLTVSAGTSLLRVHAFNQYVTGVNDSVAVATFGRRTIFSDMDQTEVSMVWRANFIFTPKASFEVYAQPLLSTGHYSGFKEFARPRTGAFSRYGADAGSIAYDAVSRKYTIDPDGAGAANAFDVRNPDFNVKSLRVNAVFRWEWRLGSTFYAVWTQQREDDERPGKFSLGSDLRSMFKAPGDNVFMVKIAYWLNR